MSKFSFWVSKVKEGKGSRAGAGHHERGQVWKYWSSSLLLLPPVVLSLLWFVYLFILLGRTKEGKVEVTTHKE